MELQKSPNRWSCLPTAFAMACNVPVVNFIDALDHDGSKMLWPELPEPLCRQAFHIQECIFVARRIGFATSIYCGKLMSTPDGVRMHEADETLKLRGLLNTCSGVILGHGREVPHAVAWDTEKIYDPNGTVRELNDFKITMFAAVDKILI